MNKCSALAAIVSALILSIPTSIFPYLMDIGDPTINRANAKGASAQTLNRCP